MRPPIDYNQHLTREQVLTTLKALGYQEENVVSTVTVGDFVGTEIFNHVALTAALNEVISGDGDKADKLILFKVGAESKSFVAAEGENNHYVALHFAQDASGLKLTYIDPTGAEISSQIKGIIASNLSLTDCTIESSKASLQYTNPTGEGIIPYRMGGNDSDCGVLVALAADMVRNNYAGRDGVRLSEVSSRRMGLTLRQLTNGEKALTEVGSVIGGMLSGEDSKGEEEAKAHNSKIPFCTEDLSSGELEKKLLRYLLEPLKLDSSLIEKQAENSLLAEGSDVEKLGQIIYVLTCGTRAQHRIIRNEGGSEIIGKLYQSDKEMTLSLVNRLHELCAIQSGSKKLNDALKAAAKSAIDHFTTSKDLLDQILTEHLTSIVGKRGTIIKTDSFRKKSGDQIGTTTRFTYEDQETGKNNDIKFYVKTQQNFKLASTSAQRTAISGAGEKIDYRELLIYKILEKTKFGPKCSFCVHPFARGAILIATQAADFTKTHPPEYKRFLEGSKIAESTTLLDERDTVGLNGLDLMARILNITDLNGDNYGRVAVSNCSGGTDKQKWKIVDFRLLEGRDNTSSIYEDFVGTKNNDSFVKSGGGFVGKIIRSDDKAQKQKLASELVKTLDGSHDRKRPTFEDAVKQSCEEVYEFVTNPGNRHYLRLDDSAVTRIKEELDAYAEVVTRNYRAFQERTKEESRGGGR